MPRKSTLVNGIEGAYIPDLSGIEDDHTVEALYRIRPFADREALATLDELIDRIHRLTTKSFICVRPVYSTTRPYAVTYDDKDRPWQRHGNLYILKYGGAWNGTTLVPVEGKEIALLVCCCLAAAS